MQFPPLPPDADEIPEQPVTYDFEDVTFELPAQDALTGWLLSIATEEKKPFVELSYIFCSDEYLRKVNVEYLEHDYYTDIITFPYGEPGEIHGDLFISSERVAENAQHNGVPFLQELHRVMAHGVLHLAGYGDKTPAEEAIMREKEDFYLTKLSIQTD